MPCYHPLQAYRTSGGVSFSELRRDDHLGSILLPCGQCIGCRMRRASDWELRVMHEASLHAESCFVTLTYAPGKLPPYGSLCHRDFQLFMKSLRKWAKRPVRFYMCGEYGPLNRRPHYHACLFGVAFSDAVDVGVSGSGFTFASSARLSALWPHGTATVQVLVRETASYCARYIMKKVLGEAAAVAYSVTDSDGVVHPLRPEYAAMSLKPGIGAGWFRNFGGDVFPADAVVSNGTERRVPRYYDKLALKLGMDLDGVEYARVLRVRATAADSTPERLKVREEVHIARVSTLVRSSA